MYVFRNGLEFWEGSSLVATGQGELMLGLGVY